MAQLQELRDACTALDVKPITCEDLIPEGQEPVGVAVMLEQANESSVQYFI